MHLTYHLPLVFIFTFLFLVFSVDAAHGSSSGHARRSLAFKRKSHRQLDIPDPLGQILNSVLGSGTSSTPDPTPSSTPPSGSTPPPTTNPSTLPTNTHPPSTSSPTPSSSNTPSTTPPPSTSIPPSSSLPTTDTSTPPTTDPGSSSPSSSPPTDTPTSTPTTSPPSSSPPPSSTPSTTSPDSSSPPPSSTSSTTSPDSSSPPPSSTPSTTSPGSSSPPPSSTPSTTSPGSSSPSPSSSTTPTCVLDLLGNCILSTSSPPGSSTTDTPATTSTTPTPPLSSPPSSSPTDSSTTPPQQTTSTPSSPPASSSGTPTPTSTSTPDCPLGVVVDGVCLLPSSLSTSPAPASSSNPPSTTKPPPSTTPDLGQSSSSPPPTTPNPGSSSPTPTPTSSSPVDPCGPDGILLGLCSSNSSPPVSTPTLTSTPQINPSTNPPESSSQSTPSLTSSPSQSVEPCGPIGIALGLCTPSVVPSSSTSSQLPSQSTDPCGALGIALGLCQSSSPPGSPSSSPSLPATITSSQSCDPLGLCGSTTPPSSGTQTPSGTVPSSGTLPGTQSQPSLSSDRSSSLSVPAGLSGSLPISTSGSSSSSTPVIAFPSGNNNNVSSTLSPPLTSTDERPFPTPPPQTQLSYITETSLLLGSTVPSSLPATLSDPDAPPPTLSLPAPSSSLSSPTPVVLPANVPARIYPNTQLDTSTLSGFSLVSILFKPALNWEFVAQNTQSQGQLFLWVPELVMNALNLTSDQVKTFALQVYVPAAYQSPADVDLLLTTFLLYIPTDQVPVLANQIKVASSAFYTGLPAPYSSLAKQVDPSFPVDAVQDPNAVPGTTTSALTSNGNKSRTEAIIGVASALGTLALVVLGLLIYRSVKRSRELRHRRLTDPNAPSPYPDRTGRDFDQDSIGGQRRRSFYFAEDSLRGDQVVRQTAVPVAQPQGQHNMQPVSQVEYSYRTSPDGVRERRPPVVTGAISAPILTQSSLSW